MVNQHAKAMPRTRLKLGDDPDEVVHATHVFHNDPDVAQVVAPYLFDEFSVMTSLDVYPARKGNSGRFSTTGDGPRRRVFDTRASLTRGNTQVDGLPVHPEPRSNGEGFAFTLAVLKHNQAVLPPDDSPHESAGRILNDHAKFQWHVSALLHVRGAPAACKDVVRVPIDHDSHCIATCDHDDKPR